MTPRRALAPLAAALLLAALAPATTFPWAAEETAAGPAGPSTTSPPVAVSSAAPHRQALVVVPGPGGGPVPARLAAAQVDAARYRDLLRLLGFAVTSVEVDTRPELKGAFARFARQVEPGGDVAVFVLGTLRPRGENLYLLPGEVPPPPDQYPTEGLRLADALRPIAQAGARAVVAVVDECRQVQGEPCRIGAASAPVSAIVDLHPPSGSATMRGELLPLMQREGLSFGALFDALRGRLGGAGVAATPEPTRDFAFLPAGFLAGLPTPCNGVDPRADADAVRRAAPMGPLVEACAEAAATWGFAPRFPERLEAAREQKAFQRAAASCRDNAIIVYLGSYPGGRYVSAVRALADACEAERRPVAPAEAPPEPQAAGEACVIGGLDPAGNNWIALRRAPSFQAPWSQTRMGPGTPLSVIGSAGDWVHVRLRSGETGWATGRFVQCAR